MIVILVAATALRRALVPWVGTTMPHTIATLALVATTVLLGVGPSLLFVLLNAVAVEIFVLGSLRVMFEPATLLRQGMAVAVGVFIVCILHFSRVAVLKAGKSEDRYRALLDLCPDAILVHAQGKYVFANPAAAVLFGAGSPGEMIGKDVLELVHPDDRPAAARRIEDAYGGVVTPLRAARFLRLDGSAVDVEVTGGKIDFDGEPAIQIVVRDITQRKRAEESLRVGEAVWEQTFDTVPDCVAVLDDQHRVVRANRAMAERLGVTTEQCVGLHCYEAVHGTAQPHEFCPHAQTCQDHRQHTGEVHEPRLGGHFLVTTTPRFDEQGRFLGAVHVARDITERKRAEEALTTTVERFHSVVSGMYGGILLVTNEGRVEFANQSFCDLFKLEISPKDLIGMTAGEIIGKIKFGYVYPEKEVARIREIVSREQPVRGEEVVMADGRACLRDFIPINFQGKSYGRLWHHIDISDRKRREERIAKLTRLYAVLSRVNEAIVRTGDAETLCAEVCRIVAEIGEFPLVWIGELRDRRVVPTARAGPAADYLEEIQIEIDGPLGAGPGGTCLRENRTVVNDNFSANPRTAPWREAALRFGFLASASFPLRRGGRPVAELTLYARDAGAFDAEQIALLESLSADLSYALDVTADLTERKRAEERVQILSEVTAQLLASDQPQRIVESLCRRVMDHLGCHVFFNFLVDEEAHRLHLNTCAGIPEETARQIEWLDYGVAVCGCAARDGCRIVAEHIQTTPDPRTDLVRGFGIQAYACHPLTDRDRTIGTLSFGSRSKPAFTEDELSLMKTMTDHVSIAMQRIRLLESLERHAREARAANEAKSRFLANMSHELRTPMNAILGMIDVALPKTTDPTVQDCLQTARGSADLLLTLLNDLLDSAKIESGKLELESAPFSLRRMLDQITRVLAVRASEKGLCFYCRLPDQTPDAVLGDRLRLQQVLLNLAGNAIKFTERGEVEVSLHVKNPPSPSGRAAGGEAEAGIAPLTDSPHPDLLPEGEGAVDLEFAVRDTGIGIPPSGQQRLFQPFAQADASMSRRFGGTGLGLSICKRLVEMMGGRIWAESEAGKGSTFHFTVRLPLTKQLPVDFEAPAALPPGDGAPLRILLVEDNPANQKLALYILQDQGHTVDVAGDGREAICLTEKNRYDVILMDVQMPGMNGLEATAAIRQREEVGSRVPIIAMTAHAMKGDRERCLAAGMDGYLSKPVNAQNMIGLVASLARGVPPVTRAAVAPGAAETSPPSPAAVFDPDEALARCFHSRKMMGEMIECFFDEMESLLPQMRAALDKGDLAELGRLGHRMKGTVAYLGAQPAREAALRVERFCTSGGGTPREAEQSVNVLERECAALKAALNDHRRAAERKRDGPKNW
jgi:PAS domain S-box-containing protein